MFFILHACKHACVRKIDDIKPIIQGSRVHTSVKYESTAYKQFLQLICLCKPLSNYYEAT